MNIVAERPGIYAVAGSTQEVRQQLGRSGGRQVLAVSFEDISPSALQSVTENISDVTASLLDLLSQRQDQGRACIGWQRRWCLQRPSPLAC
ncbi:MAG: hypothetical protein Q4B17_09865 [Lautropia sp.]|nr:hypothetical protein [Lautropia sp.]